ncbi:MAG TPA: CehA/McbA family metallohydrolase, partial [bacterium]|nr:CehA/McbA family metallohydrolase [bacterium]
GNYVSQYTTDATGTFHGHLPAGSYSYRVVSDGRDTTPAAGFTVAVGKATNVRPILNAQATLAVQVRDDLGRPVPCKVLLLGQFDASHLGQEPRTFLYNLNLDEPFRPTAFENGRTDYVEKWWYTADGSVNAHVRPGNYTLAVSRGPEYDLYTEPITLAPGGFAARNVGLHKSLLQPGWISTDLHLHAYKSLDSHMSNEDRVTSIAGEGVTFAAATDHNYLTDYLQAIASQHLEDWLVSTVGLELTTFEMGHFNGYPLKIDPASVRGGKFVWAGHPPDDLFAQLRGMGKYGPDGTIVEVNHARDGVLGYFTQFNMDPNTGHATTRQGLAGVFAPYKPEFGIDKFSLDFDALEVLNGKRQELIHTYYVPNPLPPPPIPSPAPTPGTILLDSYGQVAFPGQVEDWFTLLNVGYRHTGVGNSDSHGGVPQEPGYFRSQVWLGPGKDTPGEFDDRDVVKGLKSHRVTMTNCPMVEMTVDGAPIGSDVTQTGASAQVVVHARSANWCPFDHLTVYANGSPVLDEAIPPAQAHDYTRNFALTLSTSDVWTVAEVTGKANLFPVVVPQELKALSATEVIGALGKAMDLSALDPWGNLRPARVYQANPYALTNPVWIDHNGNGAFDAPLAALKQKKPAKPPPPPDLREIFRRLPEVAK